MVKATAAPVDPVLAETPAPLPVSSLEADSKAAAADNKFYEELLTALDKG